MPYMVSARDLLRKDNSLHRIWTGLIDAGCTEERVIACGYSTARSVPAVDVFKLHLQNGTLEAVKPGVPSEFVVVIAATHSVLPQHSGTFGDLIIPGYDHAGIACGAE